VAKPGSTAPQAGITITNADEGKTLHIKVGGLVVVRLTAGSGMQPWNVVAPDPAVLAPAGQQTYQAVGAGTAEIAATDRPSCPPGNICPQFIQAFKATVVVDAG
jgi:hypothetical protein